MNRDEIIARIQIIKRERAAAMADRTALESRLADIRAQLNGLDAVPSLASLTALLSALKRLTEAH